MLKVQGAGYDQDPCSQRLQANISHFPRRSAALTGADRRANPLHWASAGLIGPPESTSETGLIAPLVRFPVGDGGHGTEGRTKRTQDKLRSV